MATLSLDQNVSYQEKIHKQRVSEVKKLINEYKVLNRKTKAVTNKISDTVIKMENFATLKRIHVQLGGEKAVPYKTLWRWVDGRKKELLAKKTIGKEKVKNTDIKKIVDRMKKGVTEKEIKKIFREEKKKSREDYQVDEMVENFRRADFLVNHNLILKNLDQEQLSNLHELVKNVKDGLDKHFGVAKSKGKRVQRKKVTTKGSSTHKKVANGLSIVQ